MELPLAHAGHWLVYVLYGLPIAIVLGSIAVNLVLQRRSRRQDARGPAGQRE